MALEGIPGEPLAPAHVGSLKEAGLGGQGRMTPAAAERQQDDEQVQSKDFFLHTPSRLLPLEGMRSVFKDGSSHFK